MSRLSVIWQRFSTEKGEIRHFFGRLSFKKFNRPDLLL